MLTWRDAVGVHARARSATPRKVNVWSFGEQHATTKPSRSARATSSIISCWFVSEHVNIARRATYDAGQVLHRVDDPFGIHVVADVAAALADIDGKPRITADTGVAIVVRHGRHAGTLADPSGACPSMSEAESPDAMGPWISRWAAA